MGKKIIATIELDGTEGRGKIFAELEDSDYYEDGGQAYIIRIELPDGEIEDPAIAPQKTMADVEEAIGLSWGRGPWDLQWEEAERP